MSEVTRAAIYREACKILEDDGHEGDFRPDYSGRGMYSDTCPAIVSDAGAAIVGHAVCTALVSSGMALEQTRHLVPLRTDNMGLSMIYY